MSAASPYRGAPSKTFWKRSVTGRTVETLEELHQPKFEVTQQTGVATAGSCFAQHIARHMRRRGFHVIDTEPAPPHMRAATAGRFGYGVYSARMANIYYVRQLLQLAREAFEGFCPSDIAWLGPGGRWWDSQRPGVEPEGLPSPELVTRHRQRHLQRVREMFRTAEVMVFTLGLTEGWEHIDGTVYPTAPGTIAGSFDPSIHRFHNFSVTEVVDDFHAFRQLVKQENPGLRFLLTVSPVPLAATATRHHVLPATVYSKSVLRTAAGELSAACEDIDYFPSYELVTSTFAGNSAFDESGRGVRTEAVNVVMDHFFRSYGLTQPSTSPNPEIKAPRQETTRTTAEDVFCEEALLEDFAE